MAPWRRSELVVGSTTCAAVVALGGASGGFFPASWNVGVLVATWAGLLALLFGGGARPGRWSCALLGAVVAVAAWTALSSVWSDSVPSSFLEAQRTLLYVATVLAAIALGRSVTLRAAAGAVLAAAVILGCWNLAVRWLGGGSGIDAAPLGYDNSLALLAALGALFAVGFALAGSPWTLGALAPLGAVLVTARSDGSWAALASGVVVFALLASRLRGRTVALAALVVATAFAIGAWRHSGGHERGEYWHVATREIVAEPALGSGAGTFADWFLRLRSTGIDTQDAHSLYLEQLGELGPIGLLATLAVLLVPLAAALRTRRAPLAAASGAAVATYALGAGVDFHWELTAATLPVLVLAIALTREADGVRRPLTPLPRAALAAGAALLAAAAALSLAGNAPLSSATAALQHGDARAAAAAAARATRWAPWSGRAWLLLGEARLALHDRTGARAAFMHATREDPASWETWLRLADVTAGTPRRRALAQAARLNPLYFLR